MAQGQLEAFEAFLRTRIKESEGHAVSIQFVPALGSPMESRWIITHYDVAGIFAMKSGSRDTRFFPWSTIIQVY